MELLPVNDARCAFYVFHWIPWPPKHTNRHQNQTNRTCRSEVLIILSFYGGHLEFRIFGMKHSSGIMVPAIFGFSAPTAPYQISCFLHKVHKVEFLLHICSTITGNRDHHRNASVNKQGQNFGASKQRHMTIISRSLVCGLAPLVHGLELDAMGYTSPGDKAQVANSNI